MATIATSTCASGTTTQEISKRNTRKMFSGPAVQIAPLSSRLSGSMPQYDEFMPAFGPDVNGYSNTLWADHDTLLEAVAASEEKRTDLASVPSITPQMVALPRELSSLTDMHLHRDGADTTKRTPTSSTHSRNTSGELTAATSVMSCNLHLSKLPSPLLSNEPKPTIYLDPTATVFLPRVNKSSLNGAALVFSPRPKLYARAQVFAPQPTLNAAAAVFTSRPELNVNAVLFKPAYHASFGPRWDAAVIEVRRTVPALPKDDLYTNKVYKDDRFFNSLLPKPTVLVSGCAVVNGTSEGLAAPLSMVEEKPAPYKQATAIPQIVITNCDQEPELTSDDGSTSDSDISDIRSTYSDEESAKEHSWLPTSAAAPALAVEKGAFAAAASAFFDVFLDRDHASYPVIKLPGLTKQYYDRLEKVNKELEAADKQLMQLEEERRKTLADKLIAEEALEKVKEAALEKAKKEVKATKGKGGNRKKKGGKGRK
ncbi:hypothetical protein LTS18_010553 [Coniosporium uncinatum]|uniref:Uncharacterized protein n=1 Tax=Coniosporium uncinatum TaxID=93489 RepID=A0ACC3DA44_9PEZI|nr:hypothetical protein LTS18_010553 [Coniosporium uncinatum]